MKKLLLMLLLIPTLCFGQQLETEQLWEVGSSYVDNADTCAFLSDTTAADSAVFYYASGNNLAGYLPTAIFRFDSTGVGVLTWADSVTVTAYPRVLSGIAKTKEADGATLETLWNVPITLTEGGGTLCSNWSPTAEQTYFASNTTLWKGCHFYGVTYTVKVAATDAMLITRFSTTKQDNR